MNNLMIPLKYSDLLEATQKIDEVLGDDSMYYSNSGVINNATTTTLFPTETVYTYPTLSTTNATVGITYYTYPSTFPKPYQQIEWPVVEPMASPREEIAEPEVKLPGKRVIRFED